MFSKNLSRKDILGLKIIGWTVTIAIVIFAAGIWISSGKPVLDEHTLCPVTGEKMRFGVLIDKSDKWGLADVVRVKDILQSIYRDVPKQGRLTIYSIMGSSSVNGERPKSTDVKVIFDACNPGSEAECNALYSNCRKVKRDYKRAFEAPLKELEVALMVPGESSYSPLLETVGAMVKDNKSSDMKLYIISDFMENHSVFRFYDIVPLDTQMIAEYPLPINGPVSVEGYFIQRRMHPIQLQNAVQAAWSGYFAGQGVKVHFKPIFRTD